MNWNYGKYLVSTEKSLLSLATVYDFLSNRSYWAKGREKGQIEKSFEHSICFGVYDGESQIGFARVVTDYSIMYWLCDVYVDDNYRGQGIGKFLAECIVNHPELKALKGILCTKDAQGLYEKYGFVVQGPDDQIFMRKA
jgi:GNAT superfamily N-acetyltransferase